ncbi:ribose-phosphate pyrophosphokinase [Lysobacter niabensis]|uniref:ribose-phosphate pyrophosphokinase n=1 Tax=Agrilutibacter niabensis TaxID=380628 RepID=UPI003614BB77
MPVLLSFPDDRLLAASVADRIGARVGRLEWRHFPDGESLIAVDEGISGADVVLFASLNDPDRKALPLRFAARAARELGARRVGLVAPYLAYMRQDTRFHPGEAVSANAFAQFLDEGVDWLVTVDPHLHRIAALGNVFRIPATAVAAAPKLADWIRREVAKPILIGPDSESAQWVADVAHHAHIPYEVLHKTRRGDREVEVSLPDIERLRGYTPVLVDDIASSGRTLVAALGHLGRLRLPPAVCVVIHPIFAGDAWECLQRAGAGRIVSTDSIAHPSNTITLAEPIATAVAVHLAERPSELRP